MAWVREKNPKRKPPTPQRDTKDALEGLLSYLACKPVPGINVQRYLRETSTSPPKYDRPEPEPEIEIVPREPTVYSADDDVESQARDEEEYDGASLRSQRTRSHRQQHHHHHHHHHPDLRDGSPPPPPAPLRRAEAPRYVSSGEARMSPYRAKTSVQARRVVSSWSNATTPLVI